MNVYTDLRRGDRIAANSAHNPTRIGRFVRYGVNGYGWVELLESSGDTGIYAWPLDQLTKVA